MLFFFWKQSKYSIFIFVETCWVQNIERGKACLCWRYHENVARPVSVPQGNKEDFCTLNEDLLPVCRNMPGQPKHCILLGACKLGRLFCETRQMSLLCLQTKKGFHSFELSWKSLWYFSKVPHRGPDSFLKFHHNSTKVSKQSYYLWYTTSIVMSISITLHSVKVTGLMILPLWLHFLS